MRLPARSYRHIWAMPMPFTELSKAEFSTSLSSIIDFPLNPHHPLMNQPPSVRHLPNEFLRELQHQEQNEEKSTDSKEDFRQTEHGISIERVRIHYPRPNAGQSRP